MTDDVSPNELLRNFFPVLFFIPINFFIIADGMGSGIQWLFGRYQTTFVGDSIIPLASGIRYVINGTLTGRSAWYEVSPLLSLAILFAAFMYAMANRTKTAGILTIIAGLVTVSTQVLYYGITFHSPAGSCIPFGSLIIPVYGILLILSVPDHDGENLLRNYDWLFLLLGVFLIYCNWASPVPMNDNIGTEALPFSILQNHTMYLDETYQTNADDRNMGYRFVEVGNGHRASLFPVVIPVLITPLYAIPYLLGVPDSDLLHLVLSHISSSLITALSVVFIYLACRYLTGRKTALLSALIFAFATSTWSSSSQFLYAHGMSGLLLAAMLLLVIRNEASASSWNYILLGICSGLYVFNRPSDSLLVLPVIGYVLWCHREKTVIYGISAFLGSLPFLVYNIIMFGTLFGGYSKVALRMAFDIPPLLLNFLGLLIAPNRGLFVFTPVLVLSLIGFWLIRKEDKPFSRFLLGAVPAMVVTILVYASFDDWQGGETFGPRYLTCILPYMVIALCIFLDHLRKNPQTLVMAVVVMLIAVSVFIQVIGVIFYQPSTNPQEYFPNQFCSYDPWDYTDLVIVNSLYHKSARPVIRNDNGEWLRKIIEKGG